MDEPVDIKFTIDRDEYTRALRRHYKSRFSATRDSLAAIAAVGLGSYLLENSERPALAWFLIAPGTMLLGLIIYARTLLPGLIYRSQPKLKSEYRMSFREEGINFDSADVSAQLQWSVYHSWINDDEFFVLYHGPRELTVIPRRAFHAGDAERFKALLQRAIGPARP